MRLPDELIMKSALALDPEMLTSGKRGCFRHTAGSASGIASLL